MRKSIQHVSGLAIILLIILSSCDLTGTDPVDDNPPVGTSPYAENVDVFAGKYYESLTFRSGRVSYIKENVSIYGEASGTIRLTIEPGAVVKFDPDATLVCYAGLKVIAEGTDEAPILFTSIDDDSTEALGDSLKDGPGHPGPGSWKYLQVQPSAAGNIFRNCEIRYGGAARGYTFFLEGQSTVIDCDFHDNASATSYGGYAALWLRGSGAPWHVVNGNRFWDNGIPLSIPLGMSLDDSNEFLVDHDADDETDRIGNRFNIIALDLYYGTLVSEAITWSETEVPFYLDGRGIDLGDATCDGSLTIGPGAGMKISGGTNNGVIDVSARGTLTYPETTKTFTSIRDDSFFGDSNGDADATSPSNEDWMGIRGPDSSFIVNEAAIFYCYGM
ncbi:MAG: hypothetical protein JXA15_08870 [Spirochaetales bacterium]|nr:hypothetical protein [Spirochaetales bacterium]